MDRASSSPHNTEKNSIWEKSLYFLRLIFQNKLVKQEEKMRKETAVQKVILDEIQGIRKKLQENIQSSEVMDVWEYINTEKIFSIETSNRQTHNIGKKIREVSQEIAETMYNSFQKDYEELTEKKISYEKKRKEFTPSSNEKTASEDLLKNIWEIHFIEAQLATKELMIIGSRYKVVEAKYFLDLHILLQDENNPNITRKKEELTQEKTQEKIFLIQKGEENLENASEKVKKAKKTFKTLKNLLATEEQENLQKLTKQFKTGKQWFRELQSTSQMFVPSIALERKK